MRKRENVGRCESDAGEGKEELSIEHCVKMLWCNPVPCV